MVDAVVVGEADELRPRHLHHAEEVEHLAWDFSAGSARSACELFGKRLLVERDDVVDALELGLGLLGRLGVHSNAPFVMLSRNQTSAVARCEASSQAVRDFGSGL